MAINVVTKTAYEYDGETFDTMKEAKLAEAKANCKDRLPDGNGYSCKEYAFKFAEVIHGAMNEYKSRCNIINGDITNPRNEAWTNSHDL